MKVVIEISENKYKYIKKLDDDITDYQTSVMIYKAIKNGIVLPQNPTNQKAYGGTGMKKILKPSYSVAKFKADGLLYGGEVYVCDNLQDIIVQVVLTDVTNGVERHMDVLKDIVVDFVREKQK